MLCLETRKALGKLERYLSFILYGAEIFCVYGRHGLACYEALPGPKPGVSLHFRPALCQSLLFELQERQHGLLSPLA